MRKTIGMAPSNRDAGFTMVIVYCVDPERGGPICGESAQLMFRDELLIALKIPKWARL
jgi:hypothetical protein